MAAPVQVAGGNTAATLPTSITAVFGSNTTVGNTAYMIIVTDGAATTPIGWTAGPSNLLNDSHYIFWKACDGTTMSRTVNVSNSSSTWQLYETVGLSGAPSFSTTAGAATNATTATGAAMTPTAGQPYLIIGSLGGSKAINPCGEFNSSTTASFVQGPPDQTTTATSGTNVSAVSYYRDVASASGSYSFAGTIPAGGNAAWTAIMLAITQPAAGATAIPNVNMAVQR